MKRINELNGMPVSAPLELRYGITSVYLSLGSLNPQDFVVSGPDPAAAVPVALQTAAYQPQFTISNIFSIPDPLIM